jgi:hypothetical protein
VAGHPWKLLGGGSATPSFLFLFLFYNNIYIINWVEKSLSWVETKTIQLRIGKSMV